MIENTEYRPCKHCETVARLDLHKYPCRICNDTGKTPAPNFDAILSGITTRRRTKLRRSKPPGNQFLSLDAARVYYVWRMVRFHGGVDVCMPVVAGLSIHGDAWVAELDKFVDIIAKQFFGTNLAAAFRWNNALGGNVKVPEGMPATAYPCGPAVIGPKPVIESAELH